MFDNDKIRQGVITYGQVRNIPVIEEILDMEIDKAISYGASIRGCSIDYLKEEKKDYTMTLINMVLSSFQLWDKLGMTTTSQNGVSNTFEDGDIYQKQDKNVFVPLMRGV